MFQYTFGLIKKSSRFYMDELPVRNGRVVFCHIDQNNCINVERDPILGTFSLFNDTGKDNAHFSSNEYFNLAVDGMESNMVSWTGKIGKLAVTGDLGGKLEITMTELESFLIEFTRGTEQVKSLAIL